MKITKIAEMLGILDGVERQRHPGERRDRLQHLDERIECLAHQGRHADQEAERNGNEHREEIAEADAGDGVAKLDTEPLVVRPVVVERPPEVLPQFGADIERTRHRRFAGGRGQSHQFCVFRRHVGDGARSARGEMPDAEEGGEQHDRDDGCAEAEGEGHWGQSLSMSSLRKQGPILRGVSNEGRPLTYCLNEGTRRRDERNVRSRWAASQGRQRQMSCAACPHDAFLILKLFRYSSGLAGSKFLPITEKLLVVVVGGVSPASFITLAASVAR